jgi:hypothetical protein
VDFSNAANIAIKDLENQHLFAIGGIGYAGETSKGESDLDILLAEKDAEKALFQIAVSNSGAGGLYGLFGLRVLKSPIYKEAYDKFSKLPDQPERKGRHMLGPGIVDRMSGCMFFTQSRSEVAEEITAGKWDERVEHKLRLLKQRERQKLKTGQNQ